VFGQDSNYSDEAFLSRYNADLANDLGNTLSRAIKMSDSYFGGKTPPTPCFDNELMKAAAQIVPEYLREMDSLGFQRALDAVWRLLTAVNGYIVGHEPWKMFKESGADEKLSRILWNSLESLRLIFVMMAPFIPASTAEALARIGADPQAIDSDSLVWGKLPNGAAVRVTDPLFPRIDTAQYLSEITAPKDDRMHSDNPSAPAPAADRATDARTPDAAVSPKPDSGPPAETTQALPPDAARISIDQFFQTDLRVAEVKAAERVPKSKKLMKLLLSTGDAERTVVAGIAAKYTPEELVGRKVVIVANLQPAKLMGIESNGMVLAASIDGEPSLLSVDPSVPAGTKVR
jgi:methionyl-tRNA synthetase